MSSARIHWHRTKRITLQRTHFKDFTRIALEVYDTDDQMVAIDLFMADGAENATIEVLPEERLQQ